MTFVKSLFARIGGEDQLIWTEIGDSILSVKSAYFVARRLLGMQTLDRESRGKVWRLLWMSSFGPCVNNFIWKLVHGKLLCGVALRAKGVDCDDLCRIFGLHEESLLHIFFHCGVA